MSFYRTFIAAVAAMGLATAVFAADEATTTTTTGDNNQAMQATTTTDTNTQAAATTDQAKVNVNTATAKDLMKVKGLNGAKAKAIVTYRKAHGDFKSLDDLKQVKGFQKMSEKSMKKVQDQLTAG